MKPETLKKIAEAMGHKCMVIECGAVINVMGNQFDLFDPFNNPAQLLEVLDWLLGAGTDGYFIELDDRGHMQAKSLPEAIMQAAEKEVEGCRF